MADIQWTDLMTTLKAGEPIRYWGPFRGYTYGTFMLKNIAEDSIVITLPSGDSKRISMRDFEDTAKLLDGYIARHVSSGEVKDKSWHSAYIFSLVQEIKTRQKRPQRTIGDLLLPSSKIFLKPEYGPVSQEWPAASFSKAQYVEQLAGEIKANQDLILFSGTESAPTPKRYRGNLMCIFYVHPGPPIDSGLVIAPSTLAAFQNGGKQKFSYSLPASAAWSLPELPSARDLLGETYSRIEQGNSRESYVEVPRDRIESLRELHIQRIPIVTPELRKAGLLTSEDDLDRILGQILARLLTRAQQGGTVYPRENPVRIVDFNKAQLREIWDKQEGRCRLCGTAIPLNTTNSLLLASPDRIDNENNHYSSENTQLTHRACNLGRNIGSVEEFGEWLRTVKSI